MQTINSWDKFNHNELGDPHAQYNDDEPYIVGSLNSSTSNAWVRLFTFNIGNSPSDNTALNGIFSRISFSFKVMDLYSANTNDVFEFVGNIKTNVLNPQMALTKTVLAKSSVGTVVNTDFVNLYFYFKNINTQANPVFQVKVYLNFPGTYKGVVLLEPRFKGIIARGNNVNYPATIHSNGIEQSMYLFNNLESDWLSDADKATDVSGMTELKNNGFNNERTQYQGNILNGSVDLNTILTFGSYQLQSATLVNGPSALTGSVSGVVKNITLGFIIQILMTTSNVIAIRSSASTSPLSFSAWRTI